MKCLRFYSFFIVFIIMFSYYICVSSAYSKELPDSKTQYGYVLQTGIDPLKPYPFRNEYKVKKGNTLQSVNFVIIDSLANAFSYYSSATQPFVYCKDMNTLVTIKRGYVDLANVPNYTGINTKDNLFIRRSTDWGDTWQAPELIFDAKADPPSANKWGAARYPSIYPYVWNGLLTFIIPHQLQMRLKVFGKALLTVFTMVPTDHYLFQVIL